MWNDTVAAFKNAYRKHRLRVICARPFIDNSPPYIVTKDFARFTKLDEDVQTGNKMTTDNERLLVGFNRVERTTGEINSFRTKKNCLTPNYNKLPLKYRLLNELDLENMRIGNKILCANAEVKTWLDDRYKTKGDRRKPVFQPLTSLLEKYSSIELPQEPLKTKNFFRPHIWFFLEVKGVRPLGRITMELFTAAAPQVVLEFVRCCIFKQYERINFVRLFPSLWLQGELKLDDKTLIRKNIEYDKRCIDNGQHAGVLSFSVRTLRRCSSSFVPFTISFKPLRVCNGRRVAFGVISQGLKILSSIDYLGTKNGKPTREIVVTNCGVFL